MFKRSDTLLDLTSKNLMLKAMNYCLTSAFALLSFATVKLKLDNVNFFCNTL